MIDLQVCQNRRLSQMMKTKLKCGKIASFKERRKKCGKASHSWFPSAWFTRGLNLPSDITFSVLDSAVGLFDEETL